MYIFHVSRQGGVKQLVSDIMAVSTVVVYFGFLDFAVSTFRVLTVKDNFKIG